MTDRERMIRELNERLGWLEENGAAEEHDAKEAAAIKQLLQVMEQGKKSAEEAELNMEDGYYSSKAALERFWNTYETRAAIEEEKEKILSGKARPSEEGPPKDAATKDDAAKKNVFLYLAGHRVVAAVAVIGLITLGLLLGAVGSYAVQGYEGRFFLFERNEDRIRGLVSPEDGFEGEKDVYGNNEYGSVEEIPEEYREFFALPMEMGAYKAENIIVADMDWYVLYRVIYCDKSNERYIECAQQYYKDGLAYFNNVYSEYVFEKEETINSVQVRYYKYENEDDKKGIVDFQIGNSVYIIQGYVSSEELGQIAGELLGNIQE